MNIKQINYEPVSLQLYSIHSLLNDNYENSSITCDNNKNVTIIYNTLLSNKTNSNSNSNMYCNGNQWNINKCSQNYSSISSLCVNCVTDICDSNCNLENSYGLYPTGSSCNYLTKYGISSLFFINYIRIL